MMRSKISSKLVFASCFVLLCVILQSRVLLLCALIEDVGRRTPLELQQCSLYQGQPGDVNQSVRGNYKTRF